MGSPRPRRIESNRLVQYQLSLDRRFQEPTVSKQGEIAD